MIFLFASLLSLLMPVAAVYADDKSSSDLAHTQLEYHSMETSDEVYLQSFAIAYRNHRRDLSYPYPEESVKSWDYFLKSEYFDGSIRERSFNSKKFQLGVAYNKSNIFFAQISLDYSDYQAESKQSTMSSPRVALAFVPTTKWYLEFETKRQYLFELGSATHAQTPASSWLTNFNAIYRPLDSIRILPRFSRMVNSDGNIKQKSELSILYGISIWPQWFWVGLGGEHITNSEQSIYWSPKEFTAYGVRSELSVPFRDSLFINTALNLNRINDSESGRGTGHYFSSGFQIGPRDKNHMRLDLYEIDSSIDNGNWNAFGLNVRLNFFF